MYKKGGKTHKKKGQKIRSKLKHKGSNKTIKGKNKTLTIHKNIQTKRWNVRQKKHKKSGTANRRTDGNGRPIASYSRGLERSRKRKSGESADRLDYNTSRASKKMYRTTTKKGSKKPQKTWRIKPINKGVKKGQKTDI